MSKHGSEDDQSEDGELRQSPDNSIKLKMPMDYESGEDESGDIDSLDIKPPQARIQDHKRKKRDHEKSHHKRADREKHREERRSHREKHHREKSKFDREKEQYQHERERFYRDKPQTYEHIAGFSEQQYLHGRPFQDRKAEEVKIRSEKKFNDKKSKESSKAHGKESHEKHKSSQSSDEKRANKALADLRERLLEKRKGDESYKHEKDCKKHKMYRDQYERDDDPLEGEAGHFVKEILNLTSEEKLHKRERETEPHLTDEERMEQELRKEKLLEAEREMARLKEQSKAERIRRGLERMHKRNEQGECLPKKFKKESPIQVVTVSDEENSDDLSDKSVTENDEVLSDHHDERRASRSRSRSREKSESKSAESSDAGSNYSERGAKSTSKSPSKSRSRTRSKSRSRSVSPVNNQEKSNSEVDPDLPPYYPAIQGCRSVEEFKCLNKIAEGTYGVVYRAKDKRTNEIVALKRLKMEKEKEGFPITSLREINTMLIGQHANIVTVREIVVGSNMDKIFIVMDYVEHDLKSLMETMKEKKQSFMPGEIKCLLQQLLQAVAHLHDNWILHRDLKTSNLLFSHKGVLKVGDFGLAREYGSPLKSYTPIVVTLWYRAPELLLCSKEYSTPIDMWSVGCIFAEFLLMNALFPGKSEMDQLNRIFKELGTPNETIWPGFKSLPAVKKMNFQNYQVSNLRGKFSTLSEVGLGLLIKFLTYDPNQRVTAEEALRHAYFTEPPLPIDPAMFPTWPAKSELGLKSEFKRAHDASPKPPSGGREYKRLGGEDDDGYGFRIGVGVDVRRGGPGFSLKF